VDDFIEPWLFTGVTAAPAGGQPVAPDQVRAEIRAGVALLRGLLLDLVITGDQDGTTSALNAYLDSRRMPRSPHH
jgi:hypothetical protein